MPGGRRLGESFFSSGGVWGLAAWRWEQRTRVDFLLLYFFSGGGVRFRVWQTSEDFVWFGRRRRRRTVEWSKKKNLVWTKKKKNDRRTSEDFVWFGRRRRRRTVEEFGLDEEEYEGPRIWLGPGSHQFLFLVF